MKKYLFPFLLLQSLTTFAQKPEMVFVEGGSFTMGCTISTSVGCSSAGGDCCSFELPTHTVVLSSYYIGKYEVSQKEWRDAFTGTGANANPSYLSSCGDDCPVEQVSWLDALVYCNRRSEMDGYQPVYYTDANFSQVYGKVNSSNWQLANSNITIYSRPDANGYRLPSEAQWEYAARGGTRYTDNFEFSGSNNINNVAWYSSNSGNTTHKKGTKSPNQLGIFDMSGNVYEWCWDTYNGGAYPNSNSSCNPTAPDGTEQTESYNVFRRVFRGGDWTRSASYCRVSYRNLNDPGSRRGVIGVRLCRPQ